MPLDLVFSVKNTAKIICKLIYLKEPTKTEAKEPDKAPEMSTPRKMTLSLFDDDNNADDGDLFATSSTKKKETKPADRDVVGTKFFMLFVTVFTLVIVIVEKCMYYGVITSLKEYCTELNVFSTLRNRS